MELKTTLELTRPTAVSPTPAVRQVASMFGLGMDDNRDVTIIPQTTLTLRAGELVFVTGASGGGKSSLLQLIRDEAWTHGAVVMDVDQALERRDRSLIDHVLELGLPLSGALSVLATAGLADAFVLLRSPQQLSDGQRFRFRFAMAIARAMRCDGFCLLLADEFLSTLDRRSAMTIARNVRRWLSEDRVAERICLVLASAHDDLLETLQPDVLVEKGWGEDVVVSKREHTRAEARAPRGGGTQ